MKYADMKIVLAVYDERSFSKAAKGLYISQPAVSQCISQLEKELDLLLFVRDKGKILPTPACEKFVSGARSIVELWNRLESEMNALKLKQNDSLHIGTTSFFFRFLSYEAETLLAQHRPGIQYQIIEDAAQNIERMTQEGKLDFCFTRAPLFVSELKSEHLFTEELLFALPASHPACRQYRLTDKRQFPAICLSDFACSDFVMVNNPRVTPLCLRLCEEAGFQPNIVLQPVTWEHVRMGIRSGRGVGFLSNLHIRENAKPELCFFKLSSPSAQMEHVVAYRSDYNITLAARIFIDSFRSYIKKNLELI